MFLPIFLHSPLPISCQHFKSMSHGTVVYYKHSNPFDFLSQAEGLIDLLEKWGYDLGANIEQNPQRIGQYRKVSEPSLNDFYDVHMFSENLNEFRSINIFFKNSETNRELSANFDFDATTMIGANFPIWVLRFSDIDIDPGMAVCKVVCNTDLDRIRSSYYCTMEEVLSTYNLIKAIFIDLGFDVAAASREEEYFAYGEQVGSDPYCSYDGLMRLDRHGINRLIIPYEEGRRIVSSDFVQNTSTGINYKAEYDHPVPIVVREPPYHLD